MVKGHRVSVFANESGAHRWQRVPPTEKRGRVHTSTITVAVLPVPSDQELVIQERDLDMRAYRSSGPGGQHKNKTESAVELTHKPTGIKTTCSSERSQHQNKAIALRALRSKIKQAADSRNESQMHEARRGQIGMGGRGQKIRTVRAQDGIVRCEKTGRTMPYATYTKGHLF